MLNNQVRSVGFAHEANSSDDRLIQAAVSRGQSPRYGLQKTEMVATVFFTPSGKNTKTQIKPFGYRFRSDS